MNHIGRKAPLSDKGYVYGRPLFGRLAGGKAGEGGNHLRNPADYLRGLGGDSAGG